MVDILKTIFKSKREWILVFGLVLLVFVPFSFAQAAWWDFLVSGVVNLLTAFLLFPFWIIVALLVLGLLLISLGAGVLFFVLGGIIGTYISQFLSVRVVPGPETAEIVNVGWQFTRDFANMFLILILAIIGLATILKLREYEAKKMLPMLLLVALLINFSGVLVGFVVDMGNLMTNFFIERFAGFSLANLKSALWDIPFGYIQDTISRLFLQGWDGFQETMKNPFFLLRTVVGSILYSLAVFFFFVFGIWIFGIVMLIFFLRVIVLWVLSILAPIAFLSRALPSTPTVKRLFPSILHWDEWWEKLIQWTVIGIPLGFFLVLSKFIFDNPTGVTLPRPTIDDPELGGFVWEYPFQLLAGFIFDIIPPLVGLILMGLGVFISMKTAPAMAQGIINWGKKTGMALGTAAALRGGRRLAATPWAGKAMEKAARMETKLPKWLGGKTRVGKAIGALPGWGIRLAGRKGLEFRATAPGAIDKEMGDKKLQSLAKKEDWKGLAAEYSAPTISPERKIAIASLLAQEKGQKGLAKLGDEKLQEATRLAASRSPKHLKTLTAADPRLAKQAEARNVIVDPTDTKDKRDMGKIRKDLGIERSLDDIIQAGKQDTDYIKIAEKLAYRNAVKGLKVDQVENLSDDVLQDEEFQQEFVLNKGIPFFSRLEEKHGPEYVKMFDRMRHEIGSKKLAEENPAMIKASLTGNMRHLFTNLEKENLKTGERTGKWFRDVSEGNEYVSQAQGGGEEEIPTVPSSKQVMEQPRGAGAEETTGEEEAGGGPGSSRRRKKTSEEDKGGGPT